MASRGRPRRLDFCTLADFHEGGSCNDGGAGIVRPYLLNEAFPALYSSAEKVGHRV